MNYDSIDHNVKKFERLVWACRRGMLELDDILANFLHNCFLNLNVQQKQAFSDLLAYSDPELASFLLYNRLTGIKEHDEIILMVREHARSRFQNQA